MTQDLLHRHDGTRRTLPPPAPAVPPGPVAVFNAALAARGEPPVPPFPALSPQEREVALRTLAAELRARNVPPPVVPGPGDTAVLSLPSLPAVPPQTFPAVQPPEPPAPDPAPGPDPGPPPAPAAPVPVPAVPDPGDGEATVVIGRHRKADPPSPARRSGFVGRVAAAVVARFRGRR